MKQADLHVHTNLSDGTNTPEEVVREAVEEGLDCIGIVDHDTVRGIPAACSIGQTLGIEVIPGVELSAEYEGHEIHILGYFVDITRTPFLGALSEMKERRIARVHAMIGKLRDMGIMLSPDDVLGNSTCGTVGRMHIAMAMVRTKQVGSVYEAFNKYIGDNSPAYTLGFRLGPKEAIELIRSAGGVPVLAHPYILDNDELIPYFKELGLMGLEVYYPEHSQSLINFYLRMAEKCNLLVTGGSDFHGKAKPSVRLGCVRIPYTHIDALREAAKTL